MPSPADTETVTYSSRSSFRRPPVFAVGNRVTPVPPLRSVRAR